MVPNRAMYLLHISLAIHTKGWNQTAILTWILSSSLTSVAVSPSLQWAFTTTGSKDKKHYYLVKNFQIIESRFRLTGDHSGLKNTLKKKFQDFWEKHRWKTVAS